MQCKKNSNDCKVDTSSITEVDYNGNSLSTPDKSDWAEDNNMVAQELTVFNTPDSSMLANTETGTISGLLAYPNPVAKYINLYYKSSTVSLGEIVITDCNLNIIETHFYNATAGGAVVQMQLDSSKYLNNKNYRMYYSFYSKVTGSFFKGHGDIKIKR